MIMAYLPNTDQFVLNVLLEYNWPVPEYQSTRVPDQKSNEFSLKWFYGLESFLTPSISLEQHRPTGYSTSLLAFRLCGVNKVCRQRLSCSLLPYHHRSDDGDNHHHDNTCVIYIEIIVLTEWTGLGSVLARHYPSSVTRFGIKALTHHQQSGN